MTTFYVLPVFAQADVDTTVKKIDIIIEDVDPDTTEIIPEEYSPGDTASVNDEVRYFDLKTLYLDSADDLEKRSLPDSVLKKMQQDEDFWYANYAFEKEKQKAKEQNKKTPLREQSWFRTLMWVIIIGGFAVALILYLNDSNIGLFRKKVNIFSDEQQEKETDNIFEINYKERIDKAVKAGNYRLATRLMFLQLLKTMAGKNMIQYKQDRTNFDYLMQLRNTVHYNDFFRLTRNYEYSWYGNFPVNEETWHLIKNDFEKFDSNLGRK